jgi:thiol-disulfide isomerase/thioredoxin
MKRPASTPLLRPTLRLLLAALLIAGCGKSSSPTASINAPQKPNPREVVEQLAARYRAAKTYQDAGELRFLVDGAPEDQYRSLPFSVALVRPNKLRVHALDTMSVADGTLLRSMVQSLPGQVLQLDCPKKITTRALESDAMLNDAMHGQLDVDLPQLVLLAGDDPIETLTRDCTLTQLADSEFQGRKCTRIELAGPAGRGVMWIEKDSGLLVKYEFPLDEIRRRFPLARLWAEFRGATVDSSIEDVAFEVELPEDVKVVKKFVLPPPAAPPALLAQQPEKFTFVALDGTALGSESLAGKVVVLDLWATWCGWCFEGLPLLQKVYDQYKDNDEIEFLAVSKDDLTVSNAAVAEAFAKHNLTIPIVRDQEQLADRVFQLEGLPTTIVLGKDGTVQYYHVGYDAKLAETLPAELDKLLTGENLAQPVLDTYEQQKQEFEQRLSEVLVESGQPQRSDEEVARTPSTVE